MFVSPKTYRLLREFERAVRDDEMKGAQPPEDRNQIERRMKKKKAALIQHLKDGY